MAMPIMSRLSGAEHPVSGDLREMWDLLLDRVRGNGNQEPKHPAPSSVGDAVELTGSIETLKISVQMRLERGVYDSAGKALGTRVIDLNLHYNKVEFAFDKAPATTPAGGEGEDAPSEVAETEKNPYLAKLLEYISPENTAQRIAGFIMNGFGKTSFGAQGTPEARQNFVDFITPFMRQGVAGALSAFGDALPDEIRDTAEQTATRVEEILAGFASGSAE